jgi:acid phosphatase type 7
MKKFNLLLILCIGFSFFGYAENEPYAFYLTWVDDPTTTIVIDWHEEQATTAKLFFKEQDHSAWKIYLSNVTPFPFASRHVHRVSMKGLEPDTTYELKFSESGEVYHFRTMPENLEKHQLKIAIGGDAMHQKASFEKMNKVVAAYEPDFVIIGGDMAYENGAAENIQRIFDWFDAYATTLITENRRILPCLVAAGNHEVVGGYHSKHDDYEQEDTFRAQIAPYFYALFAFPGQPGYNVLDFGKYLSLIILDTEHSNPIEGMQTEWLEEVFEAREDVIHKIPIYHVPAYPSVREYNGHVQTLVRETWTPLFEANDVKIAFENHDHAYKRTFPIKEMELDPDGIVYVGDGSWGVEPRPIHEVSETWYLEKAMQVRAFTLLTLACDGFSLISVDEEGDVIDAYSYPD